jgi:hypothetical protein
MGQFFMTKGGQFLMSLDTAHKTRRQGPREGIAEAVVSSNNPSLSRRFEPGFLIGKQAAKIFILQFLQIFLQTSLQIKNRALLSI